MWQSLSFIELWNLQIIFIKERLLGKKIRLYLISGWLLIPSLQVCSLFPLHIAVTQQEATCANLYSSKFVHMTKFSPLEYKQKWQTHAPHMVLALKHWQPEKKMTEDHEKPWITDGRATHQCRALITMWTIAQWPHMWERNKFLSCMRQSGPTTIAVSPKQWIRHLILKKTHYRYIFKFVKYLYVVSNF